MQGVLKDHLNGRADLAVFFPDLASVNQNITRSWRGDAADDAAKR